MNHIAIQFQGKVSLTLNCRIILFLVIIVSKISGHKKGNRKGFQGLSYIEGAVKYPTVQDASTVGLHLCFTSLTLYNTLFVLVMCI